MTGKKRPGIRILTFFLAAVLTVTSFSSVPAYASAPVTVDTVETEAGTQTETETETEMGEEVSEKEPEKTGGVRAVTIIDDLSDQTF